jgi:hypothetical protein
MTKMDVERLLRNESPSETLKKTYEFNHREVYISFKRGMVEPDGHYLIEKFGKNIKLTQTIPLEGNPEPLCRKMRTYVGRSPCISLPTEWVKPNQLFRVIKLKTGIIWLLRIDSFSYADETSIPPEFLKVV